MCQTWCCVITPVSAPHLYPAPFSGVFLACVSFVHSPASLMHSWHEEKLHSHEHYVPRCLHTETLNVDCQYVPNRHRANLDEVRRKSEIDAPLAQKQSRPVLLVHTDHDANLPAGLPTKKGIQVERNTARRRASTLRYLLPRGVQDDIAATRSQRRLRIQDISQTVKLSTRKPMDPVADNKAHAKASQGTHGNA